MFLIDSENKKATSLERKTFGELGFSERYDLQEWIYGNPEILGEQLLIIQKEFAGFDDTRERLDLLALDLEGNLVIIENKLDDSGRDVTWQALKYASYCVPLTKSEICEIYQKHLGSSAVASERICEFLDDDDFDSIELNNGKQRIILVAANFRKEVTATVLYLNNHQLDIKCIKVTPYQDGDRIYIDSEQILPVQDVGDYQIRLSAKKQENIVVKKGDSIKNELRREFWETVLPFISEKVVVFKNLSGTKDERIVGSSGYSGIWFCCRVRKNNVRAELYIDTQDKEKNKRIFDLLFMQKNNLECAFGDTLNWHRSPDGRASKINIDYNNYALNDRETWITSSHWLAENMEKLYATFKKPLDDAVKASST